jgi:hypothetical protein
MTGCVYCHRPLSTLHGVYQRVTGWERKATTSSRRGGSDIVLRQPLDEWACAGCVHDRQAGVIAGQMSFRP